MLKLVLGNPWVQALALALALFLVGAAAYFLSPVLIPLGLAFLAAYVFDPVVRFLERRHIRRSVSIAALALLALIVLLCIPMVLIPSIISQAEQLARPEAARPTGEAGSIQERVAAWIDQKLDALPLEKVVEALGWAPPDGAPYDPREVLAKGIGRRIRAKAVALLQSPDPAITSAGQQAGTTLAKLLTTIGNGIVGFILFLANFALFAFVAAYLLNDFDRIKAASCDMIPPAYRPKTLEIAGKIDTQLRSFLRGQLLVCVCLGVIYAAGLLLSGVPFAVPLAVFGAVANFVPYLGLALTIVPALMLALLQHGVDWQLLAVALTFVAAQMTEGMFLTPKIVGEQVGLSPVWVILAIMVFGSALGFLGLLLAVPIAASLKVLVVEALAYYKRASVYTGNIASESDQTKPQ